MKYLFPIILVALSLGMCKSGESPNVFKQQIDEIVIPCGEQGTAFYNRFTPIMENLIVKEMYPDSTTLIKLREDLFSHIELTKTTIGRLKLIQDYDKNIPVVKSYLEYYGESVKSLSLIVELIDMMEKRKDHHVITDFISGDVFVQHTKQDESAKKNKGIVDRFSDKYIK